MNVLPPVLTPRLQKIADLITPCSCVADIGTDHAYLPAYLCLAGVCRSAIASDIRPGPLERAAATLNRFGLADRAETRLGGGTAPLAPGEADAIVMAGMGGLMIAEIIKSGDSVIRAAGQVILQPMTAAPELREYLLSAGYAITGEYLVREEEKLYHILTIASGQGSSPPAPLELYLGKGLMDTRPAYFAEYCLRRRQKLLKMTAGLARSSDPAAQAKLAESQRLLEEMDALGL